jgi:long-chain acyl-CoA synthetase
MDAIQAETNEILRGLPDRISHVIRRHAAERPDHPALADGTTTWSYGTLSTIVADLAGGLVEYGVRPGDRLLIVSENSLRLAAFVLAASEIDAWVVVVNPRLSPREIDQIRDHSGARRVFYVTAVPGAPAREHADRHGADTEPVGQLGLLGVGPLNETATPEPVETDGARQVAALMYTSGTTGNPKGVMLTHRNLLYNAGISGRLRHLAPADRLYGVLPMSHIVGLSNILIGSLMFGVTIQVVPRYDPAELARAIAEDGVSLLFGVPATYQRLLEYKAVSGRTSLPRGRLRYLGVAGAPLDPSLKARVEAEFGLKLLNGYGITECAPGISGVRAHHANTQEASVTQGVSVTQGASVTQEASAAQGISDTQGVSATHGASVTQGTSVSQKTSDATQVAAAADISVGQPLPGVELRVVDADRQPVAPNEIGELHVRSPGVMRGYYRAPELTAAAIDDQGWFNTGDLVRFDGTRLFVVGRTKELIIRSGFNVYPPEVEAVLNMHPDVVQSAVVARSVAGNEEVVAYVQLLPGSTADAETLMRHASPLLTAYKRPSEIVILDTLPASSTGKILKHKLTAAARDAVNA